MRILTSFVLTFLALTIVACGKKSQNRTKNYSLVTQCKDTSYSLRGSICVRPADQCPKSRINPDSTCKQLPCSPGLYFDGQYCKAANTVKLPTNRFAGASFTDLCLGTLTNDQKYTWSSILKLGEKGRSTEELADMTWEMRCTESFGALSRVRLSSIQLPYGELRDLTPLIAFEDLPDIQYLIIDVSTTATMTCPLSDPNRCIFKAW
jgi:hypothetical protein